MANLKNWIWNKYTKDNNSNFSFGHFFLINVNNNKLNIENSMKHKNVGNY